MRFNAEKLLAGLPISVLKPGKPGKTSKVKNSASEMCRAIQG